MSTGQDDGPDELIAAGYAAAAGHRRWPAVLDALAARFRLQDVQITVIDRRSGHTVCRIARESVPHDAGVPQGRMRPELPLRAGMSVSTGSWFPLGQRLAGTPPPGADRPSAPTPPNGGSWGIKLHDDGTACVLMTVSGSPTPDGPVDVTGTAEAWRRVVFHLGRAVELGAGFHRAAHGAALAQTLIERLGTPVVMMDDQRQVLRASPSALALMVPGRPLWIDDGQTLRVAPGPAESALLRALSALSAEVPTGPARPAVPAVEPQVLALPVAGRTRPWIGMLVAIRPQQAAALFGARPLLMLLVHDTDRVPPLDPLLLVAVFDLTPAEARVAAALAAGCTPQAIATRHGTSINTVQTQIRGVQHKLGVARTTDAVAVLAGLPWLGTSATPAPPRAAPAALAASVRPAPGY